MNPKHHHRLVPFALGQCTLILIFLTGCVREISVGGIYFPAWLICGVVALVVGTLVSLKIEPFVVPTPGYFQMLVRFSFIVIFFVVTYLVFFVLL